MVIVGGLVTLLIVELKSETTRYNNILQGPVQDADAARRIQLDFKKQVQEWKDILLRGHNPDDLAKYTRQFHEQEGNVKTETQTMAGTVQDPAIKLLPNDFLAADDKLSASYQSAYCVYVKEKFDFKSADKLVRGQDRPPTDLFDKVVAELNARVVTLTAAQHAATLRQLKILLIVVGALLVLDSYVYCSVLLGVLRRLAQLKGVSDRLARADTEGLSIDISGNDEIGEIGESMKGVAAAIEELLAIPSH